VQSRLLQEALRAFAAEVSEALQAQLAAGAEVPFELAGAGGRAGRSELQFYSPMTGTFIAEHWPRLGRLPARGPALSALQAFRGLDRYVAALDLRPGQRSQARGLLADHALRAFCEEVFHEQSDFALREGRLQVALSRLEAAQEAQSGSLTLLATLHGLAILSPQLQLAERLIIARPETISGVPEEALWPTRPGGAGPSEIVGAGEHLLIVLDVPEQDERVDRLLDYGRELLRELLRALRLYGDGRIALGSMAWACAGEAPFAPMALDVSGRPQGVLVVRAEQEDELRAFCSLTARRVPREGPVAWALRRFELGCERSDELEGLSDHLLGLQALLEPERAAHGLLAARTAALCAPVESRQQVAARVLRALELERDAVRGQAAHGAGALELAREIAAHLRALLRDVICGHLESDLAVVADELLHAGGEADREADRDEAETALEPAPRAARPVRAKTARPVSSRARSGAKDDEQTRVLAARRVAQAEPAGEPARQSALPL
jgi:hypothetical protein